MPARDRSPAVPRDDRSRDALDFVHRLLLAPAVDGTSLDPLQRRCLPCSLASILLLRKA